MTHRDADANRARLELLDERREALPSEPDVWPTDQALYTMSRELLVQYLLEHTDGTLFDVACTEAERRCALAATERVS